MKPKLILLVLLVACLAAQAVSLTCIEKNPFIAKLAERGVKILSLPQADPRNKCQYEWAKHKTCCDSESLEAHANRDQNAIMTHLNNVNAEFLNFAAFIQSVHRALLQIVALQDFQWRRFVKDQSFRENFEELISEIRSRFLARAVFYIYKKSDYYANFKTQNDRCWQKMSALRNSALCSTCSGVSQNYFSKKKANLEAKTCNTIMVDCWESFKMLNDYIRRLNFAYQIFDLGSNIETPEGPVLRMAGNRNIDSDKIKQIYDQSRKARISYLIEEYHIEKEKSSNSKERFINQMIGKILCRRYVKLQDATIIQQLDKAIGHNSVNVSLGPFMESLVSEQKKSLGETKYEEKIKEIAKEYRLKMMANIQEQKEKQLDFFDELAANTLKKIRLASRARLLTLDAKSRELPTDSSDVMDYERIYDQLSVDATLSTQGMDLLPEVNVVTSHDSMFTAFDGVAGSHLDRATRADTPMNLTLAFP